MSVSAIIATCDTPAATALCVESLLRFNGDALDQLVIVDNNDLEPPCRFELDRRIRVIRNRRPKKHGESLDQAVALTSGDWIVTIDSDVEFTNPRAVQYMHESVTSAGGDYIGLWQEPWCFWEAGDFWFTPRLHPMFSMIRRSTLLDLGASFRQSWKSSENFRLMLRTKMPRESGARRYFHDTAGFIFAALAARDPGAIVGITDKHRSMAGVHHWGAGTVAPFQRKFEQRLGFLKKRFRRAANLERYARKKLVGEYGYH